MPTGSRSSTTRPISETPGAPEEPIEEAAPELDDETRADIQAQANALAEMLTDDDPDDEDDVRTEVGALLDLLGPLLSGSR